MVVLLTILGTIFLIVSAIFWSETPKLRTVSISWQGRMRIALAIQQCKKLKKNNYGKRI